MAGVPCYLAAFLNIASIWLNHHDLFTRIARVDVRLMGLNLVLLLITSLLPWPAAVLAAGTMAGDQHDQVVAVLLYAAIGFLVPVAWISLYGYAARHPDILTHPQDPIYMRLGIRHSLIPVA